MMQTPRNPHTQLTAQLAVLILVAATGGLLLLTLSERAVNGNLNASPQTSLHCRAQTLEQRVAAADLIVAATVFAVIPNNDEASVLLTPLRTYKGSLPPNGIVVAARSTDSTTSSAVTGDLHFTSNDPPYLLFLKQRDNSTFATSVCFGSRLLGDELTQDEQALLGEGT